MLHDLQVDEENSMQIVNDILGKSEKNRRCRVLQSLRKPNDTADVSSLIPYRSTAFRTFCKDNSILKTLKSQ